MLGAIVGGLTLATDLFGGDSGGDSAPAPQQQPEVQQPLLSPSDLGVVGDPASAAAVMGTAPAMGDLSGGQTGLNSGQVASGLGSLLTAGGQLAAGAIGGAAQYYGQSSANATNIALQQQAQAYNTQMANTAHQREVKDLEAAGLNPILSAGGSGAGYSPVAPAQVQNSLGGAVQAGQNSASSYSQAVKDRNANSILQSQTETADNTALISANNVDQSKSDAVTAAAKADQEGIRAERMKYEKEHNFWQNDEDIKDNQATSSEYERDRSLIARNSDLAGLKKTRADSSVYDNWWGKNVMPYLDSIGSLFHSANQGKALLK